MRVIDALETLDDIHIEPDIEAALKQVLFAGKRRREKQFRRASISLMSLTAVALTIAIPAVRVAAQDVYADLTIRTIGVTPHFAPDLPRDLLLPNVFPIGPVAPTREVSLAEAKAFVPFRIQLPQTSLLPYEVKLFAHEERKVSQRIEKARIHVALDHLGRQHIDLPAGLDNGTISITFHKSISARFGDCPQIVGPWRSCAVLTQGLAPTLTLPSELQPEKLATFSFQLLGMSAPDANALARIGIVFFPPEDYAWHKVVHVNGRDAVLVAYKPASTGSVAYNLSWSDNGISYSLFGRDPSTAVSVAESLR